MERFAINDLAETILSAPAWARIGITALNERLRQEAAIELARTIRGDDIRPDPAQLALNI